MSSLCVGIAMKYAVNQYTEQKWKKLYENLWLLYQLEDVLYQKLKDLEKDDLKNRIMHRSTGASNALLQSNAAVADE